ncbi:MAG: LptF/LptG family permease [Puniceicoccales bacterium]|nr:LptF/LptG family permease [Puniceicoccales bacterium]
MKLYARHIFFETLVSCAAAVTLFVGILLAANAMRDIVEWITLGRLTFPETLRILGILMPSAVSYALPLGMMTGILVVIGRMSSQNEILAMKTVGIGLMGISWPIFLLSAVCAVLSAYINLYHAPDSVSRYRKAFRQVLRENPMRFIVPRTFNHYFRGYVIYVDSLKNGKFNTMKIWQFTCNDQPHTYITAESGEINFDETSETFLLKLHNGTAENFDDEISYSEIKSPQIISFKDVSVSIPSSEILETQRESTKKLHHMLLNDLLAAKMELDEKKSELQSSEIKHRKTLIDMQINTYIANAVGIFVMALLAIPLGIATHRSDTALNAAIALFLCLAYYFAMVIFSLLGENTWLRPDILVWTPNLVLLAVGFSLFNRALQH